MLNLIPILIMDLKKKFHEEFIVQSNCVRGTARCYLFVVFKATAGAFLLQIMEIIKH